MYYDVRPYTLEVQRTLLNGNIAGSWAKLQAMNIDNFKALMKLPLTLFLVFFHFEAL